MDLAQVRQGFVSAGIPTPIIDEIPAAYEEAKRRYHLGDHRPQEVEGGRFAEAVLRALQHVAGQPVTPIGKTLPSVDALLKTFENATGQHDSVRLHIPRTLKVIYDIRNRRDVAHLADGIDPNLQDATLVIGNMDWVLAELVRLYHGVDATRAQEILEDLVTKEVPAIQEINGHPVILSDLQARDQALLLLYRAGAEGASLDQLADWLRLRRKDHLRTRLEKLDSEKLVLEHPRTDRFYITERGVNEVESRRLAHPSWPHTEHRAALIP
jgi:hypothetical protein